MRRALDGVKDGVIEDPRACHFNPAVLTCKGADADDCLDRAAGDRAHQNLFRGEESTHRLPRFSPVGRPLAWRGRAHGTWSAWIIPAANRTPAQFNFA